MLIEFENFSNDVCHWWFFFSLNFFVQSEIAEKTIHKSGTQCFSNDFYYLFLYCSERKMTDRVDMT